MGASVDHAKSVATTATSRKYAHVGYGLDATLPPPEERAALLDALAELISKHGCADFVRGPIHRATPESFPDGWAPTPEGVEAMIRRICSWSRVAMKDIEIEAFEPEAVETHGADGEWSYQRHGAAAWYAGHDEGTLFFGVAYDQLEDAEALAGVLAHEVAHAWRDARAVMVDDDELEEQLTDITADFLGYGVLTSNNAFRHRSSGGIEGTRTATSDGGYLSPQAHSFLLAAQLAARGNPRAERSAVREALDRTQRAALDAALALPELEPSALRKRLAIGEPEQWPEPEPRPHLPVAVVQALDPGGDDEDEAPQRDPSDVAARVTKSSTLMFGLAVTIASVPLALMISPLVLAVVPVGFFIGSRLGSVRCSACDMVLKADEARCPQCGRTLTDSAVTATRT